MGRKPSAISCNDRHNWSDRGNSWYRLDLGFDRDPYFNGAFCVVSSEEHSAAAKGTEAGTYAKPENAAFLNQPKLVQKRNEMPYRRN